MYTVWFKPYLNWHRRGFASVNGFKCLTIISADGPALIKSLSAVSLHVVSQKHAHLEGWQAITHFKRRGMVSSQVMLFYSPYSFFSRAAGVSRRRQNNGGELSDLSAPIVAHHIINVRLWVKSRPLPCSSCIALSSPLCWTSYLLSVVLPPHAALHPLCRIAQ